jgi:hypothetical protein
MSLSGRLRVGEASLTEAKRLIFYNFCKCEDLCETIDCGHPHARRKPQVIHGATHQGLLELVRQRTLEDFDENQNTDLQLQRS